MQTFACVNAPCNPAEPQYFSLCRVVNDVDFVKTWMINRPTMGVPPVEELKNLVQKPLAEGEKIPIPLRQFASLLSISVEDRCSQDDLSTLFTLGEFPFHLVAVLVAVHDPAPESHTV